MSSQIDFRTLPANVPILCIPRVYPNISESRIRRIFDDLNMGSLDRIDIVPKSSEKGEKFNRVFVHFKRWNDSENANTARERLLNGKEIKIIYDEPWFWKISAYREAERKSAPQQPSSRGKATLAFDSDDEKPSKPITSNYREDRRRDDRPQRREERPRSDYRDSRRPRQEERFHRRRDDSRERPRHQDERLRRQDERPRQQDEKKLDTRTTSNSPPRERPEENQVTINYGDIIPPKKRNFGAKKQEAKPLKIEVEEGEVAEMN